MHARAVCTCAKAVCLQGRLGRHVPAAPVLASEPSQTPQASCPDHRAAPARPKGARLRWPRHRCTATGRQQCVPAGAGRAHCLLLMGGSCGRQAASGRSGLPRRPQAPKAASQGAHTAANKRVGAAPRGRTGTRMGVAPRAAGPGARASAAHPQCCLLGSGGAPNQTNDCFFPRRRLVRAAGHSRGSEAIPKLQGMQKDPSILRCALCTPGTGVVSAELVWVRALPMSASSFRKPQRYEGWREEQRPAEHAATKA